jgi:uncharacterized protein (DUF2336 family)
MNLRALDNSPHLAKMLVKLHDKSVLNDLLHAEDNHGKFAEIVTGLFDKDIASHEREVISDFLITVVRRAERDMRMALSSRIAEIDEAPLRLVLHLANEDIEIASPVLEKSTVLSDTDLIYIVKGQGPDYWRAIAKRENLGEQVIDVLADTKDDVTAITLSQNDRAVLTKHAFQVFEKMAKDNDDLAGSLLERNDLPAGFVSRIYKHVSEELKGYIHEHIKDEIPELDFVTEDVTLDFTEATKKPENMPSSKVVTQVKTLQNTKPVNIEKMMETLTRGDVDRFTAMFAEYTGLSVRRVHDFIREACPKGFAIACRAFGIQKGDFSRIYLLTNRLRAENGIVNHNDMIKILTYFDSIRPDTARRVVDRSINKKKEQMT